MSTPTVSVCLPVFNGGRFLGEALQSVLSQSLSDLEVVAVDDRSTDGSYEALLHHQDPRVRVFRNARTLGIPGNWNRALGLARAKYACIFHQDDLMAPDNLAAKVALLDKDPSVVWVHSGISVDQTSAPRPYSGDWLEDEARDFVWEGDAYLRRLVLTGNRVCAPTVVARRAALRECGSFNPHLGFACDYEMWMRLCLLGRVAFLRRPLVAYRWHRDNASHRVSVRQALAECHQAVTSVLQCLRQRAGREAEADTLQEASAVVGRLRGWLLELEQDRNHFRDRAPSPPRPTDPSATETGDPPRRRVLFVIHALPPASIGGSELQALGLATHLAPKHQVGVFAGGPLANDGYSLQRVPGHPFELYSLTRGASTPPDLLHAYQNPEVEARFSEVLRTFRPDVVHFHGTWGLSNQLPLQARAAGACVLFTLHDFWLMCPRGQRRRVDDGTLCWQIDRERCAECLSPWVAPPRLPRVGNVTRRLRQGSTGLRLLVRQAAARLLRPPTPPDAARDAVTSYHALTARVFDAVDLFIAPSRFLRDEFVRYGLPEGKVLHLENGIHADALRGRPKSTGSTFRFGFVGSLIPSKGAHVLVEAFRELPGNCELLVFGESPGGDSTYAADLRHAARGDGRIHFRGRFAPAAAGEAFSQIDVLVVPSVWFENSPLAIQEAFASGTPVIAARLGGMEEHVRDGVNGLLFTPGDHRDLSTKMRLMADDAGLRGRLRAGRPTVKTLQDAAVELDVLYERLLRGPFSGIRPAARPVEPAL